jgi:hypothetical protein
VSAHFLVSWVQRGAGVGPNADARPRTQNPADNLVEVPDPASGEDDEGRAAASVASESPSASSIAMVMPHVPDSPAGTSPSDVSDRVILVREVVHPAVREVPYTAAAPASPTHHEDHLTPTDDQSFSSVSVRPVAGEPEPRRETEPLVLAAAAQPTPHVASKFDAPLVSAPVAISTITDPYPAPRAPVGEPMSHWMPRVAAPAHAHWREHDAPWREQEIPARENHVEVRIGRIEIVQPAAPAPVQPRMGRQPRGFGDARMARRYVDRKWY